MRPVPLQKTPREIPPTGGCIPGRIPFLALLAGFHGEGQGAPVGRRVPTSAQGTCRAALRPPETAQRPSSRASLPLTPALTCESGRVTLCARSSLIGPWPRSGLFPPRGPLHTYADSHPAAGSEPTRTHRRQRETPDRCRGSPLRPGPPQRLTGAFRASQWLRGACSTRYVWMIGSCMGSLLCWSRSNSSVPTWSVIPS